MGDVIGIGQLGYGGIGKIHTLAYRSIPYYYPGALPEIRLAAVCTSNPKSAAKAAQEGGFARGYSSIEELAADPAVTVIDCSLPNFAHKEAIRVALAAGKHIYCEKPLAVDGPEAMEMAAMAQGATTKIGMTFNYRFIPAMTRAKALIDEGALGRVYSFQLLYLHTGYQDESRPLSWRMDKGRSGGGALLDLGSHIIDLTRYLLGDFAEVSATARTFVTERPVRTGASEKGPVTVDDAVWMQARLTDGSVGTLEVSRFATGSLDDLIVRIEGERGAMKFSLMEGNWLWWFDPQRGWIRIDTVAGFPGATIPPGRSILGWSRMHAENQYQFLRSVVEGRAPVPGLADGVATQLVMQAAYESAETGRWTAVPR
jgi:predicted dehydrogenase